jgi:UDP-3-O-[3-hydroxymyristoyl] glucosamine N-acyltransferase
MSIPFAPRTLAELVARYGGSAATDDKIVVRRIAPIELAGAGDLAPVLHARFRKCAESAFARGAVLLVDTAVAQVLRGLGAWVHPQATWAMAQVLTYADVPNTPAVMGRDCLVHPTAILYPRVKLGNRVRIGPYAVIGQPGFGFAHGPDGGVIAIPHAGGVVIADDVTIGAHCTVDAGTLTATHLEAHVHLDSHVHIGHNCYLGTKTMIAAQAGLAGSVTLGRNVLIGGQAGIADHVHIGDSARVAAKSGVIGDVPERATVAGYPAVARARWLRGIASMYEGELDVDPEL